MHKYRSIRGNYCANRAYFYYFSGLLRLSEPHCVILSEAKNLSAV